MRPISLASIQSLFVMSDEQAMWRVQNSDDEQAFAQLMRRWEGPIQRLCARMTGDTHRAEDLAQETFARVFSKRSEFNPSSRFSTWIWRIALNLCHDDFRRRQRRDQLTAGGGDPFSVLETVEAAEPAPDQSLANRERGELVRAALLSLPEIYRTVLVLRHYENLKFREIADVLGIPEGTVKSRMAEGLSMLSSRLNPAVIHDADRRANPKSESKEHLML